MSIFTSRVTKDLSFPNGDGTLTIRKLNQKQLQQALIANFREQLKLQEEIFGAEQVAKMREKPAEPDAPKDEAPADEAPADPLSGFDKPTLMAKAVVVWSLPEPLTAATFEDVDDETATWLATEILRLSKPSLFESKAQQEAGRKNV